MKLPFTLGSTTTFRPLISCIRRKKSRRSTFFRFTEIGSPVYVAGRAGVGACCCCGAAAGDDAAALAQAAALPH